MKVFVKAEATRLKMLDAVKRERDALVRLSHPNVAKLVWTFQDRSSFYFVQELVPNGTLATLLTDGRPMRYEAAKVLIGQLLLAIGHLHRRRIVHRDIKPANLLFDAQNRLKLCDFGSCRIYEANEEMDRPTKNTFVGTPDTMASEMVSGSHSCFASDLWALGCVLYWVLAGHAPFRAESRYLLFQRIREGQFDIPDTVCDAGRDLIRKLLVLEPTERLGWSDAQTGYQAIRGHPFFEGTNWETLSGTPIEFGRTPIGETEVTENSQGSDRMALKMDCVERRRESIESPAPRAW
jgi:3-phosphoinositide dependent protein kinase-1